MMDCVSATIVAGGWALIQWNIEEDKGVAYMYIAWNCIHTSCIWRETCVLCVLSTDFTYSCSVKSVLHVLSTDSMYSHVPGDQGGPLFVWLKNFLAVVLPTNWCTTMCIVDKKIRIQMCLKLQISMCKIVCNKLVHINLYNVIKI